MTKYTVTTFSLLFLVSLLPKITLANTSTTFGSVLSNTSAAYTSSVLSLDTASSVELTYWPEIEAKSAFIYDPVGNKVLFEKNADVQRPIASLLKLMTAATANGLLNTSPKLVNTVVKVGNAKNETAADFMLSSGSTWYPEDLMKIMLLGSSNKAAETIASQLIPKSSFMSLMNFNAKRIGLTQTYFRNPTGLTESTTPALLKLSNSRKKINSLVQSNINPNGIIVNPNATSTEGRLDIAGGVSTAREVAKLMWATISENPGLLDITREEKLTIFSTNSSSSTVISNTNKVLKDFPIIFGKTGFTENAGGNLAIVMQKNQTSHPYIIVVLDSTIDKRFDDIAKLASTTLQFISKY